MPFALSDPEISRRDESAQFSDLVTNAFSAARSREGEGRPRPPLPRSLSKLSPQPSQGTREGGPNHRTRKRTKKQESPFQREGTTSSRNRSVSIDPWRACVRGPRSSATRERERERPRKGAFAVGGGEVGLERLDPLEVTKE